MRPACSVEDQTGRPNQMARRHLSPLSCRSLFSLPNHRQCLFLFPGLFIYLLADTLLGSEHGCWDSKPRMQGCTDPSCRRHVIVMVHGLGMNQSCFATARTTHWMSRCSGPTRMPPCSACGCGGNVITSYNYHTEPWLSVFKRCNHKNEDTVEGYASGLGAFLGDEEARLGGGGGGAGAGGGAGGGGGGGGGVVGGRTQGQDNRLLVTLLAHSTGGLIASFFKESLAR